MRRMTFWEFCSERDYASEVDHELGIDGTESDQELANIANSVEAEARELGVTLVGAYTEIRGIAAAMRRHFIEYRWGFHETTLRRECGR